jgi:DNA-3-methyladenine glycosylase II
MPPEIITHLSKDKILAPYVEEFKDELQPQLSNTNVYEDLVCSIIGQQLSTNAAKSIETKFRSYFGITFPTPDTLITIEHDIIRSLGLSNSKVQYVKNVAQFWLDHNLIDYNWGIKTEQEIIDLLVQIKGVGRWTVEMVLMFELGRDNIFPIDDLGVVNGMALVYGKKVKAKTFKKWATKQASLWSPYQSWGSRLMWKSYDKSKLKI